MAFAPLSERYVAVLDMPGGRRFFCSDQYRDEWTGNFGFAETFRALHEAIQVAERHGGHAMQWREAHMFEGTSA
jgi:hypothetical protein